MIKRSIKTPLKITVSKPIYNAIALPVTGFELVFYGIEQTLYNGEPVVYNPLT